MKKQTILNLLNSNIKNIEGKIGNKIDCIGSQENLKLYDVSDYCYENDIDIELFNKFCQVEYDFFEDFLNEKNVKLKSIGRTSSFYVQGNYFLNSDSYCIYELYNFDYNLTIREKIGYIIENYFHKNYNIDFNLEYDNKGYIVNFEYEEIKNYILIYNYAKEVLKNLYLELKKNNVIEEIENIFEIYEYIKTLKIVKLNILKSFWSV